MQTDYFKELRVKKGYSQKKLSTLLQISKPSLSKKERGLIPFKIKEILILKQVLDLTPEQIDKIFLN